MQEEKNNNDELKIINLTRHLTQSMINKNIEAIDDIVDPDFTLTHITGYVQSRKDWFEEIFSERMKYYSYQEIKTEIQLDSDKAVFIGQNLLDARIWGSRNNWRLQQIMHLEKQNDKWIILKSVATTF